ncbi:MAG: hypothetical protein NZZ41_07655, partial [Candidatus Dojkabacteria bacterium]|nr:hypothetical protein [Candidatus Dojkabacteria bacterium]
MQFSGKRAAFIIRKNEQFNSKLASKLLGKEISKNNIYKYALLKINSVFLLPAAISRYKTGMFYNILAVEPKNKNIVQKIKEKSFAISFFVDYKNSYMNFGTAYSSTSTLSYSLNDYFVRIFSLYISAYNFFIDTSFNFIDKANQIKYENVLNKIFYFFLMDKSRILKFSSLFFEYKTFKFKIKIESLLGSFITDNWIYVHHEGFSIDSKGLFIEDKY